MVSTTQIVQLNIITVVAMLWIAAGQSPLCADNPVVWLASCKTGCEVAEFALLLLCLLAPMTPAHCDCQPIVQYD